MEHKRLLVTGFEPFGGQAVNPSWLAVSALPERLGGAEILTRLLPVDWARGPESLLAALRSLRPDGVLCVGQAGGRDKLSVERVAVNLRGGADNAGVRQEEVPVTPGGPAAYFATLPCGAMRAAAQEAGIPAEYSYSAGVYLCNCVMYTALHAAAGELPGLKAGFLHVPFLPEQTADKPSMSREMLLRGVALCAEAAAKGL